MKHRLFVAINPPPEVLDHIGQLQRELDKLKLPIKWNPLDKIHITLAWLGHLPAEEVARMRGIVANTARQFRAHQLQPVAIDTMYQRHEPSLVYLLLADPEGELAALQKELTRKVDEITPQPRQKFLLHITIGWVLKSDPTRVKHTLDEIDKVEMEPWPKFSVTQMTLYESFSTKAGSSYSRMGSFNLGNRVSELAEVS
ncbi:MAG: RNA 2',3'-cyclic phosphodiesterase [bacterium]|nr:RNA 2',3'-cyclic phosphodiesterase [bacterium]